MDPQENGERFRAKVVQKIVETNKGRKARLRDNGKVKFLVSIEGSEQPDQIVDYNVILDYINSQQNDGDDGLKILSSKESIVGHQGPLNSNHPDYRGSTYNVMVAWGDGRITYEPLSVMKADSPVTCARYGKENDLLDTPGWKSLKGVAKSVQKLNRLLNQSKKFQSGPKYKFGFRVPRTLTKRLS